MKELHLLIDDIRSVGEDYVARTPEDQKTYLMRVLFAEGTKPLSLDQMQQLTNDQFCLEWLDTNTQFDYERFKATMESLRPVDQERQQGKDATIWSVYDDDWLPPDEMIEHLREVHAEEIKQSRDDE